MSEPNTTSGVTWLGLEKVPRRDLLIILVVANVFCLNTFIFDFSLMTFLAYSILWSILLLFLFANVQKFLKYDTISSRAIFSADRIKRIYEVMYDLINNALQMLRKIVLGKNPFFTIQALGILVGLATFSSYFGDTFTLWLGINIVFGVPILVNKHVEAINNFKRKSIKEIGQRVSKVTKSIPKYSQLKHD